MWDSWITSDTVDSVSLQARNYSICSFHRLLVETIYSNVILLRSLLSSSVCRLYVLQLFVSHHWRWFRLHDTVAQQGGFLKAAAGQDRSRHLLHSSAYTQQLPHIPFTSALCYACTAAACLSPPSVYGPRAAQNSSIYGKTRSCVCLCVCVAVADNFSWIQYIRASKQPVIFHLLNWSTVTIPANYAGGCIYWAIMMAQGIFSLKIDILNVMTGVQTNVV